MPHSVGAATAKLCIAMHLLGLVEETERLLLCIRPLGERYGDETYAGKFRLIAIQNSMRYSMNSQCSLFEYSDT